MTYNTDERLKSYLDTNQIYREQMCLALLSIDKRFSEIRPIHPRGGPDGGRDIEAKYKNDLSVFGAVGFVNQASDTSENKKQIKKKFTDDAKSALKNKDAPEFFVFFTNINFTHGEKQTLTKKAKNLGFKDCEVFDRERIRILLDGADGLAIRFQYLSIPLSEAEQATFFARWGDDIQSVISTGFQRIESTLDRILFLQEASNTLDTVHLVLELNQEYAGEKIGHFRAFCHVWLKEPKHGIYTILFGAADKSNRMRDDIKTDLRKEEAGIRNGIGGGQWEQHIELETLDKNEDGGKKRKYLPVGSSSSVGMETVKFISIKYSHDLFFRYRPRLSLRDLDEAMYMPILNKSLAEKIRAIHVYANGYKLQEIKFADFEIDESSFKLKIPAKFSKTELKDKWVRVRPKKASCFHINFFDETPNRLFTSKQTPNSLGKEKTKE